MAGKAFNLTYFGLYATESMRLEKGSRPWKSDLIYEHNPFESRLDRFVNMGKNDFIGKQALQQQLERGHRKLFVSMTVDCDIAPPHSGDPVFYDDHQVGTVTSGGYGFRVEKNIAYAFVNPAQAETGTQLRVGILGDSYQAIVVDPVLYDPANEKVRS